MVAFVELDRRWARLAVEVGEQFVQREVARLLQVVLDDPHEYVLLHDVSRIALITARTVSAADAAS